jgi:hypothetical protein
LGGRLTDTAQCARDPSRLATPITRKVSSHYEPSCQNT